MLDRPENLRTGRSLVETVMASIRTRIEARQLVPGARLPSVRDCAAALSVSKSTVVEAYDRLVAEGEITARRGSGFYVAGGTRPLSLKRLGPELDRAIDPLWVTRQAMSCGPEVLKPGWGWLPSSWLPDEALQRVLRKLSRDPDPDCRGGYGSPLGFTPLREHLALRLAERGVKAEADQIMLTDSASHGLDLVFRLLLQPGDTVLVDDPCYFNFHAMLRGHRATFHGVPFGVDGLDIDAFGKALAEHRPRIYVTNAGLHNPTGVRISAAKVHRVLQLAEKFGTVVVEDEAFADFEAEPAPRLAGFDGLDRVVAVGSYSKTVTAAARCGYVAGRPDWIDELVDLKLSTSLGSGHMAAVLLHHMLTDGTYRRHVEGLRTKLSDAMGRTRTRLARLGIEPFVAPDGGMFIWGRLPAGIDSADVARFALPKDVIFAPGNVFSATHSARSYLRFNVARCAEPRVFEVLAEAIATLSKTARRADAVSAL